jgi:murein tripeptide amidase MpaA
MRRLPFVLLALHYALAAAGPQTDSWLTYYEQSGCTRTPRYDETITYCRRLATASSWVRYISFGTSPQGRELPLVILSRDRAFTPAAARRTGKPVVLIQSGIHAGEIDGKDASMMLMRDIAVRRTLANLLDHVTLLVVPIFNVDGHERFGPYNRINQNGPEEMGWRVTAQNLNLNRDYMKADTPEMRAMLKLFSAWLPDLYVDCHVTDGIDFQYDVTYAVEYGGNIEPVLSRWVSESFLPNVLPRVESSGHKIFYYVFPREDRDIRKGIECGAATPRFSTGYAAIQNRPALLIETHMLKPYRTRVSATYEILKASLECINGAPALLRDAVRQADAATVAAGAHRGGASTLPLTFGLGKGSTMRTFLGVQSSAEIGRVSGKPYDVFTTTPVQVDVPVYNEVVATDSVDVPYAYLIPQEWRTVIERLQVHGVTVERLRKPVMLDVNSYRFTDVTFRTKPYEGRQTVTYTSEPLHEQRTYPAGTAVVWTAQRAGKVAMHLLEPRSGDSFAAWGFFNPMFEQKEYAETYVMEKVGKGLLEQDSVLRKAFEGKLARDSAFAADPQARVNWLYLRSPWKDPLLNVYPVGRISVPVDLQTSKW